jgi:hypothetical protein
VSEKHYEYTQHDAQHEYIFSSENNYNSEKFINQWVFVVNNKYRTMKYNNQINRKCTLFD